MDLEPEVVSTLQAKKFPEEYYRLLVESIND